MSNSSDKRPLPFHWFWWIVAAFCLILAYYFPPYQVAFKVGFVFLAIALVLLGVSILIRIQRYDADELARQREEEERRLAEAERQRKRVDFRSPLLHGCVVARRCDRVDFDTAPGLDLLSLAGSQLRLGPVSDLEQPIPLHLGDVRIGALSDPAYTGMVRDSLRRGDPVVCAVTYVDAGLYHANLTLLFYRPILSAYLDAHADAHTYRLIGTSAAALQLCSAGDFCALVYDNALGKYNALLPSGQELGFLPASAALVASQRGTGGSSVFVAFAGTDAGRPAIDVYLF